MEYELCETVILARINTAILPESTTAILLPESEKEAEQMRKPGFITVAYQDSMYETMQATDIVAQDDRMQFEIIFQAKNLRGEGGIYNLHKLVSEKIIGFSSNYFRKIYAKSFKFITRQDGVFFYQFMVEAIGMLVEKEIPDDYIVNPATKITMKSNLD